MRSGAVIDLVITKGHVQALVVGSERTPYRVSIDIRTMAKAKWDGLVGRMTGKISSLMALAAGKLPKELLEDFCNVETGLFPKSGEITLSCDWTVYRIAGETLKELANVAVTGADVAYS